MKDDGWRYTASAADVLSRADASVSAQWPIFNRVCRCPVGKVVRVDGTLLLFVRSVNTINVSLHKLERRRQGAVYLLERPGEPVFMGCKHKQGRAVDTSAIADQVRQATRSGQPVLVTAGW